MVRTSKDTGGPNLRTVPDAQHRRYEDLVPGRPSVGSETGSAFVETLQADERFQNASITVSVRKNLLDFN